MHFPRLKKNFGTGFSLLKNYFAFIFAWNNVTSGYFWEGMNLPARSGGRILFPLRALELAIVMCDPRGAKTRSQRNIWFKITATAVLPRNTVLCRRIFPRPQRLSHMGSSRYDASGDGDRDLPSGLDPTPQEPGDQNQCILKPTMKTHKPPNVHNVTFSMPTSVSCELFVN